MTGKAVPKMHRPCEGVKKGGEACKAFAVPGTRFCMAHRERRKLPSPGVPQIDGKVAPVGQDEQKMFREVIAQLDEAVHPRHIGDYIGIQRLALAILRAARLDAAVRAGDAKAEKQIYFTDLNIQNWLVKLGIDRRFRVTRGEGQAGKEKSARPFSFLSDGAPAKAGRIPLERGEDEDEDEPDEGDDTMETNGEKTDAPREGADTSGPGGVHGGGAGKETAP